MSAMCSMLASHSSVFRKLLSLTATLAMWGAVEMTAVQAAEPGDGAAADLFVKREFKSDKLVLPYRLLTPANYDKTKSYPVVLFLHGAGERGNDNIAQLKHGMNDFCTATNRCEYPCFVVAPQCPANSQWVLVPWSAEQHTQPERPSEPLAAALAAVAELEKEFNIDSSRFYITGLSMGGYGTWDAIQRHPERFAAAVPVCGGGDEKAGDRLTKIPVWAFHGALDTAVKPERSRKMIAAIKAAGGDPKYTEYEDVAHDSWVRAYSDPEMMKWMFAQKLPEKPKQ